MNLLFPHTRDCEKGVALYLAIIVTFMILGIGLGISSLLVAQLQTTRSSGESLQAFYAADAGIERLQRIDRCFDIGVPGGPAGRHVCLAQALETTVSGLPSDCKGGGNPMDVPEKQPCRKKAFAQIIEDGIKNNINNAFYSLCKDAADPSNCDIEDPVGDCTGSEYCGKSSGTFRQTKRAVEISK